MTNITEAVADARAESTGPQDQKTWTGRSIFSVVLASALIFIPLIMLFLPLQREAIGVCAVLFMVGMIFVRVPVGIAMIVAGLLGMYALRGSRLVTSTLTTVPYHEVASWSLSVIPMFILMGLLLWKAGLTESMYGAAQRWLGWMPGGLAVGTNLAGAGLASVSGSTAGMTHALARIGLPEMFKAGYDRRLALGGILAAGLGGQLIPPSILLVIYAGIAEVPIGPQLLAGIGPGILVTILFTINIIIFAKFWAPTGPDHQVRSYPWGERLRSLLPIWPIPLIVAIIAYGMFSGTFTATEAGALAALLALIITAVWTRKAKPVQAVRTAATAAITSVGAIFFMLVGVEVLSRMLALTGVTSAFSDLVTGLDLGRVQFLILMMFVYLLLGTFLEPLPMMVLTVPILIPTLESMDISLIWFGVFAVFMGELAVITPPVGILSFIIFTISRDPEVNGGQRITIGDVFIAALWFIPMAIVVVLVLIFFPEIATWLPDRSGA